MPEVLLLRAVIRDRVSDVLVEWHSTDRNSPADAERIIADAAAAGLRVGRWMF